MTPAEREARAALAAYEGEESGPCDTGFWQRAKVRGVHLRTALALLDESRAENDRLRAAAEATNAYFSTLADAWQANDDQLVVERSTVDTAAGKAGIVIVEDGTLDRLFDTAYNLTRGALGMVGPEPADVQARTEMLRRKDG